MLQQFTSTVRTTGEEKLKALTSELAQLQTALTDKQLHQAEQEGCIASLTVTNTALTKKLAEAEARLADASRSQERLSVEIINRKEEERKHWEERYYQQVKLNDETTDSFRGEVRKLSEDKAELTRVKHELGMAQSSHFIY